MSKQLYRHSEKVLATVVGDDIVALNVEHGQCYGMEKVTAVVWNLLAKPNDVESICDQLVGLYDVELDVCRADVEKLLGQFRKEGLLETIQTPR